VQRVKPKNPRNKDFFHSLLQGFSHDTLGALHIRAPRRAARPER
jgi:hypothetical protein